MSQLVQYRYGSDLYSFNTGGWFNATEAAGRFGKRPVEWLRLPATADYLAAFERRYGKIPHVKTRRGGANVTTIEVGKSHFDKTGTQQAKGGGQTWFHPKLAVRFAQWLDEDFAVWCDLQIDTIIRSGIQAQGSVDLIPLYLRPDATPWEKRFPESYYRALARVTRTDYHGHTGGTPAVFGQMTDRWVYDCILPADVHEELRARRSESQKMHQWLTGGGVDLLDKQIHMVVAIASTSTDVRDFSARMMSVSGKQGQLSLILPITSSAHQ